MSSNYSLNKMTTTATGSFIGTTTGQYSNHSNSMWTATCAPSYNTPSNMSQFSQMIVEVSDFGSLYANDKAILSPGIHVTVENEDTGSMESLALEQVLSKAKIPYITLSTGQILASKDTYEALKIMMKMLFEGAKCLDVIAFMNTIAKPNGKSNSDTPATNP